MTIWNWMSMTISMTSDKNTKQKLFLRNLVLFENSFLIIIIWNSTKYNFTIKIYSYTENKTKL